MTIDMILDKKYKKILIEHPASQDRTRLVQNKGAHVAWHKRLIKLDHELSSDEEDECDFWPHRSTSSSI